MSLRRLLGMEVNTTMCQRSLSTIEGGIFGLPASSAPSVNSAHTMVSLV